MQANVLFSVKDEGPGINPEVCTNLFKPFVQENPLTTRLHDGIGLGLAICKKLVGNSETHHYHSIHAEAMSGQIGVKSELGKGAEFFFHLPFKEDPTLCTPTTITHQLLTKSESHPEHK